jgi:hypothetical protein
LVLKKSAAKCLDAMKEVVDRFKPAAPSMMRVPKVLREPM